MVLKATAQEDSAAVEAWFTPQIPLPGGPGHYRGLPGMILVVSVDDGRIQYTATEVAMAAVAEGVIVEPTEGESVTREEYDAVVIEKMEELRRTRGGGL
jgi:GLPGLI family protein